MTFTLCRLVIHSDGIEVLSFVFDVCVCVYSHFVVRMAVLCYIVLRGAVGPYAAAEEYMCSASVAHFLSLVGEALAE